MALSASSDSVAVDEIKELLLTCSMCSETLNDPRSLSCLHHFCKVCLGEYIFFVLPYCLGGNLMRCLYKSSIPTE
jgi:hypothetical protein